MNPTNCTEAPMGATGEAKMHPLHGPVDAWDVMTASTIFALCGQVFQHPLLLCQQLLGFDDADFEEFSSVVRETGNTYIDIVAAYMANQRVQQSEASEDGAPLISPADVPEHHVAVVASVGAKARELLHEVALARVVTKPPRKKKKKAAAAAAEAAAAAAAAAAASADDDGDDDCPDSPFAAAVNASYEPVSIDEVADAPSYAHSSGGLMTVVDVEALATEQLGHVTQPHEEDDDDGDFEGGSDSFMLSMDEQEAEEALKQAGRYKFQEEEKLLLIACQGAEAAQETLERMMQPRYSGSGTPSSVGSHISSNSYTCGPHKPSQPQATAIPLRSLSCPSAEDFIPVNVASGATGKAPAAQRYAAGNTFSMDAVAPALPGAGTGLVRNALSGPQATVTALGANVKGGLQPPPQNAGQVGRGGGAKARRDNLQPLRSNSQSHLDHQVQSQQQQQQRGGGGGGGSMMREGAAPVQLQGGGQGVKAHKGQGAPPTCPPPRTSNNGGTGIRRSSSHGLAPQPCMQQQQQAHMQQMGGGSSMYGDLGFPVAGGMGGMFGLQAAGSSGMVFGSPPCPLGPLAQALGVGLGVDPPGSIRSMGGQFFPNRLMGGPQYSSVPGGLMQPNTGLETAGLQAAAAASLEYSLAQHTAAQQAAVAAHQALMNAMQQATAASVRGPYDKVPVDYLGLLARGGGLVPDDGLQ